MTDGKRSLTQPCDELAVARHLIGEGASVHGTAGCRVCTITKACKAITSTDEKPDAERPRLTSEPAACCASAKAATTNPSGGFSDLLIWAVEHESRWILTPSSRRRACTTSARFTRSPTSTASPARRADSICRPSPKGLLFTSTTSPRSFATFRALSPETPPNHCRLAHPTPSTEPAGSPMPERCGSPATHARRQSPA